MANLKCPECGPQGGTGFVTLAFDRVPCSLCGPGSGGLWLAYKGQGSRLPVVSIDITLDDPVSAYPRPLVHDFGQIPARGIGPSMWERAETATGADLDHIASGARSGMARRCGETDEHLRERIAVWSPARRKLRGNPLLENGQRIGDGSGGRPGTAETLKAIAEEAPHVVQADVIAHGSTVCVVLWETQDPTGRELRAVRARMREALPVGVRLKTRGIQA